MKIIDHLADLFTQHQKKLEMLAVFLMFCAVGFRFKGTKTSWLWNNYSYGALLIILFVLLIAIVWIRIEKHKTANLITEIKKDNVLHKPLANRLDELSARQREVFNLIVQGKSNKDIMDELSIELSTLKTHINKIYKTLDIVSRKQIRAFKNGE